MIGSGSSRLMLALFVFLPVCALRTGALAQSEPPGESDFDLASLVQDEYDNRGQAPLVISGFADFSYVAWFLEDTSTWAGAGLVPYDSFMVGNLNVYLTKELSPRCRALAEVRYLYEPNGYEPEDGQRVDTTVGDHAAIGRPIQWGGIRIERAHAECDLTYWLTLRMGQWLTPYGIWNVDHGSPTIIAIRRPYVVGEALLPEQQTGLQLFGSRSWGRLRAGYHLTLSNGRGPIDSYRDMDRNKGVGARLELGYSRVGELILGGSYYRGRYTDLQAPRLDLTTLKGELLPRTQYDEQSLAFDLSWNWHDLVVRAEYLRNERRYLAGGRALVRGLLLPDGVRDGDYVLIGYRTPWLGIMPYVLTQRYRTLPSPDALFGSVRGYTGGLNILIAPALVLKTELFWANLDRPPFPTMNRLRGVEGQVSWAF
jgi:hypothetical protein